MVGFRWLVDDLCRCIPMHYRNHEMFVYFCVWMVLGWNMNGTQRRIGYCNTNMTLQWLLARTQLKWATQEMQTAKTASNNVFHDIFQDRTMFVMIFMVVHSSLSIFVSIVSEKHTDSYIYILLLWYVSMYINVYYKNPQIAETYWS